MLLKLSLGNFAFTTIAASAEEVQPKALQFSRKIAHFRILIPYFGAISGPVIIIKPLKDNTFKGFLSGDPEGIRTPNQQNRNLSFYPVELRSQDYKGSTIPTI